MSDPLDMMLGVLPPVRDNGFSAAVMRRVGRRQFGLQALVWSAGVLCGLVMLAFIPLPRFSPALLRPAMQLATAPGVAMAMGMLVLSWAVLSMTQRE